MQHQSCPFSHSSSRCTCPLSDLHPNTPVFAFNVAFCDPDPNEIDPLDSSCLSKDTYTKANAPDGFMLPTQSPAIVRSPFERQRYFIASHSSIKTPPLSGYTETLSTSGSTPSLALLWTPRSLHMHDFRHSHPLQDKQRFTPDLYKTIYSGDQNDSNAISLSNRFANIRRAEQENTPPARTSTSTIWPDAPRNKTFLELQLLSTFDENIDIEKVTWEGGDDVDAKEHSDELDFNSRALAPRNLLRRGAVCCASIC